MLRRELTFCCHQGLTITQAKQLCRLAGLFKSEANRHSFPSAVPKHSAPSSSVNMTRAGMPGK